MFDKIQICLIKFKHVWSNSNLFGQIQTIRFEFDQIQTLGFGLGFDQIQTIGFGFGFNQIKNYDLGLSLIKSKLKNSDLNLIKLKQIIKFGFEFNQT